MESAAITAASGSPPLPRWDNKHAGRLKVGEKTHELSRRQAIVMDRLLERPGRIIPAEELINAIYADRGLDEPEYPEIALRVLISKIRSITDWKVIIRYVGRGYADGGYCLGEPLADWAVGTVYKARGGSFGPLELTKIYGEPMFRFRQLTGGEDKYISQSALSAFGLVPIEGAGG